MKGRNDAFRKSFRQNFTPPPPRGSRAKFALTALLAAFFLCGQAQSIEITAMTPSADDALEGDASHYIMLYTDADFVKVDWYVVDDGNETLVKTYNGTGTFDYLSGFDYDGYGAADGNAVSVKAVATADDGNADAESVEVVVWEPIKLLVSVGSKYVAGQQIPVSVSTNIDADKIEYNVDGGETHEVDSSFTVVFDENEGSRMGSPHTITVTAHAEVAGHETSDDDTRRIKVYAGNGYIWISTGSFIADISKVPGTDHEHVLETWHSLVYYNDSGKSPRDSLKTVIGWAEKTADGDLADDNVTRYYSVTETNRFHGYITLDGYSRPARTLQRTLRAGSSYAAHAYTNLTSDGNAQAQVTSPSVNHEDWILYKFPDYDLPPLGYAASKFNPRARFLYR